MTEARFQIFSVTRRLGAVAAADEAGLDFDDEGARSAAMVTWRFLSANNRSLGRGAMTFTDIESCRAAVVQFRHRAKDAVCATLRDGANLWFWRVRVQGIDVAVSSRRYQRRVQAEQSCSAFLALVRQSIADSPIQVLGL